MARKIEVEIVGDASSYQRALGSAQKGTSKFGTAAKAALVGGAAAGLYAVGKAAKIGWDEYNQGAQAAAQTNAAIKSTGGVAGVTAKHVTTLANAMLLKSGIDDEATQAAENQLLTFTKIGASGGIFDKTTRAVADLATRLNDGAIPSMEQMSSTGIMVGKALNNPAVGMTRLQRVGVEFTDSLKATITKLQQSGHLMEAQSLILKVLQQQYGGSAKAAGQTFGGQLTILHERLNNFLGDVVGKAIPYLQRFGTWLLPLITKASKDLSDFWKESLEPTIRSVVQTLRVLWDHWGETITKVVVQAVKNLRSFARIIGGIIRILAALIRGDWSEAWQAVKDTVRAAVDLIVGILRNWKTVVLAIAKGIGGALKDGIMAGLRGLGNLIGSAVRGAINIAVDALNALGNFTINVPGILPGPSSYTFDFPDIPHVATGGYVAASGLAVIHRGETVTPAASMARGGGRVMALLVGDTEIIRQLRAMDERSARRSGRGVL